MDWIVEGVLHCVDSECMQEYPIIDGIPILVPDVRTYLTNNLAHLTARTDLSPMLESMLGDGAGPGSPFDVRRQHLSTYASDHYGEDSSGRSSTGSAAGSISRCLAKALELVSDGTRLNGPALDVGSSVGRATFDLAARTDGLALGVDLNFSMLQMAQNVARNGRVCYPRRRLGVVYDRVDFQVHFGGAERVDFWACDALALPFSDGTFGFVAALNVLDCVSSPRALLGSLAAVLRSGGEVVLATPYDWSIAATPMEGWLGGHSQRGPDCGAAEPFLRALLTPGGHPASVEGLVLAGELQEIPWHTRLHDRSSVEYQVHVVAARST